MSIHANVSSSSQNPSSLLKQQVQQLCYTLQIKQKKIIYLQSQLKSAKSQNLRKIQILEKQCDQLKRQNHLISKQFIHEQTQSHSEMEQKIRKNSQQTRNQVMQKDKFYQKLLNQKEKRFQSTLKGLQQRYDDIIDKIKQQNKVLHNLLITKNQSKMAQRTQPNFTFGVQQFAYQSLDPKLCQQSQNLCSDPASFIKQKMTLLQQIITLKKKHQKLLKQIQTQKKITRDLRLQNRNIQGQLNEEIKLLRKSMESLNRKIDLMNQEQKIQKNVYDEKIAELQELVDKYKKHLRETDQNHFNALTERANTQRQIPVTSIKACNHQGLIIQLERNISLKNQQIQELHQRIKGWQKMLGFNKNFGQRLQQIGNISERSENIYKNQKDKMKKQIQRIDRK